MKKRSVDRDVPMSSVYLVPDPPTLDSYRRGNDGALHVVGGILSTQSKTRWFFFRQLDTKLNTKWKNLTCFAFPGMTKITKASIYDLVPCSTVCIYVCICYKCWYKSDEYRNCICIHKKYNHKSAPHIKTCVSVWICPMVCILVRI